jgi:hypothetical protein
MRPSINDIIVWELQAEHDDIISYRQAVATGIDNLYDPTLDDIELTDALKKVIAYYKIKTGVASMTMTDEARDIDLDMGIAFDSDNAVYPYHDEYDSKRVSGE